MAQLNRIFSFAFRNRLNCFRENREKSFLFKKNHPNLLKRSGIFSCYSFRNRIWLYFQVKIFLPRNKLRTKDLSLLRHLRNVIIHS